LDSECLRIDLANRLTLRPAEAATVLGVSDRTLRAMLPALPHFRVGTMVLIPVEGLRQWVSDRAHATPTSERLGAAHVVGSKQGEAVAAEVLEQLRRR
jgi:excisionase family DNA binding protein